VAKQGEIVRFELPGRPDTGVIDNEVKRVKISSQMREEPLALLVDRHICRSRDNPRRIGAFADYCVRNGSKSFN
jgi:hypothetical protein